MGVPFPYLLHREAHCITYSWKDVDLNWSLINAINDDLNVQQGLFPGVDANTSTQKGGGKKKTEWQEVVARTVFEEHPTYKEAYALTSKTPKDMRGWALKIKNRLQK